MVAHEGARAQKVVRKVKVVAVGHDRHSVQFPIVLLLLDRETGDEQRERPQRPGSSRQCLRGSTTLLPVPLW